MIHSTTNRLRFMLFVCFFAIYLGVFSKSRSSEAMSMEIVSAESWLTQLEQNDAVEAARLRCDTHFSSPASPVCSLVASTVKVSVLCSEEASQPRSSSVCTAPHDKPIASRVSLTSQRSQKTAMPPALGGRRKGEGFWAAAAGMRESCQASSLFLTR